MLRCSLRRARKSRAEPQAHPDGRRTFHEPRWPPGVDAESACQGRAVQTGVATERRRVSDQHPPTPQRPQMASEPRATRVEPVSVSSKRPETKRSRALAVGASVHATQLARSECARLPAPRRPTRAEPEEPRRAAGTPRRAPHLSRAARTTGNRRGARERSVLPDAHGGAHAGG